MKTLLEKTRRLNLLLHNSYNDICIIDELSKVLSEILDSCILIINKKGKIITSVSSLEISASIKIGNYINSYADEQLNYINKTKENYDISFISVNIENNLIIPINCDGNKQGILLIYRLNNSYSTQDIILGEYGATIIGLEMSYLENEEIAEKYRKNSIVKSSISTLSYSELEAIIHIFDELKGKEGLVIASKVADKVGITRSVIVNALRKLESAGIIESRSLGMKGTYIKILNDMFLEELKKLKQ